MSQKRCDWCEGTFDQYVKYHDEEWGSPNHDDKIHYEFLVLESAQAGLSWSTILKRREGYRALFAGFVAEDVAQFTPGIVEELLTDKRIIRNRMKIEAAINNANQFIEVQKEFGSFDQYVWGFVNGEVKVGHWNTMEEVPATTAESDALAKDMKKRGFKFLGSTILYAYMQAMGLANDHIQSCYRYDELT